VSEERLQTYLTESKRVMRYYEKNTQVRFDPLQHYTDYYPEAPGGRRGGRSMESRPFNGTRLGDEFRSLRRPHPQSQIMGKFGITAGQAKSLLVATLRAKLLIVWLLFRYMLRFMSRRKYGRDTMLYCGNALAARLRGSLLDRNVPVRRNSEVTSLVIEEGRVVGVRAICDGREVTIGATKGVVLAAGGFERNREMREKYQRSPISDQWTAAHHNNVGDGIRMGLEAGGTVDLMDDAWWTPTTLVPESDVGWVLVVEKSLPGSIFVDRHGKRFCNEAAPYIDVVNAMYDADDGSSSTVPCYLVFDARFRKNYPVGPIAPGYAQPDSRTPRRYRDSFLMRGKTLDELAEKCDLDAAALKATIERFNMMAVKGVDEDFGRGESYADRYYGDYRIQPNPCLAPLKTGPFYAIKVYPGDLGTKGGLKTDLGCRVVTAEGEPIAGLYAAGNTTASVMGRSYPGAGGTIGPALTFGFIAAERACSVDG
jgi:3-oxosteroid 1-dehydrogenase